MGKRNSIVILGDGILGKSFDFGIKVPKEECDLRDYSDIKNMLEKYEPEYVINCTGVGRWVSNARPEQAYRTNCISVLQLASGLNAKLIQFSTIYSGTYDSYCRSKMAMEDILPRISNNYLLIRLPMLLSKDGGFYNAIKQSMKDGTKIPVYKNEVIFPVLPEDVAEFTRFNLDMMGTISLVSRNCVSRENFVSAIAKGEKYEIDQNFRRRQYPFFKGKKIYLRPWEEALECLESDSSHHS